MLLYTRFLRNASRLSPTGVEVIATNDLRITSERKPVAVPMIVPVNALLDGSPACYVRAMPAQKHEYMSFSKGDRDELTKVIANYEDQGWELFTITEGWAWYGEGGPPKDATHLYTAWMRRPR
jgi:hypothetical protein